MTTNTFTDRGGNFDRALALAFQYDTTTNRLRVKISFARETMTHCRKGCSCANIQSGLISLSKRTKAINMSNNRGKMDKIVPSTNVRLLRTTREVEEIREFWKKTQFYHTHDYEFVLESLQLNSKDRQPYILLATEDGMPAWVLVGCINQRVLPWKLGYKKLLRRPVKCLEFQYNSSLGLKLAPHIAEAIIEKISEDLRAGIAHVAWFWYLSVGSPLYGAAKTTPRWLCRDPVGEPVPHRTLNLPGTFKEFRASRGKNTKSNIRQYRNRMEKKFDGSIKPICYSKESEIDIAIQAIVHLEKTSWQYRNVGQRIVTSQQIDTWHDEARVDMLFIHVLYVGESPIAFFVGKIYKKRYVFEFTGYDPKFEYYHPGMYLLLEIIHQFCSDDDVDIFDFGFSDEQYKRQFSDTTWQEESVAIFSPGFGGLKLLLFRCFLTGGTAAARTFLSYFGILGRIKMYWRHS